jgi:multiple sugar transport system permease protein
MKKKNAAAAATKVLFHSLLLSGAIVTLIPFVWMFSTSVQTTEQVLTGQSTPQLIPSPLTFFNYAVLFVGQYDFGRYLFNSVFVVLVSLALELTFCSMAAFSFARLKYPLRDEIFILFLAAIMVPSQVTMVGLFSVIKSFGWVNRYAALIVPNITSVFGIFLLRQFFLTIPFDYDESATIDGAGKVTIFLKIVLPLAKPAIATLIMFSFVNIWNDFLWPLVATNTDEMRTLQIGLSYFIDSGSGMGSPEGGRWNQMMAGAAIATVPTLIVFLCAQRYFIEGIAMTGLKS